MSNNQNQYDEDDFDEFDEFEEPAPKPQGSDLIKQLRKRERAQARRLQELEAENAALKGESRSRTVSQILEAEGVSPKIAQFIPAEITDKDAVKAWLVEYSDLFGVKSSSPKGEPDPDEDAFNRMNNMTEGALSPSQIDDIYRQIDAAQSPEEVMELMTKLG